jgi:hypothetical protein
VSLNCCLEIVLLFFACFWSRSDAILHVLESARGAVNATPTPAAAAEATRRRHELAGGLSAATAADSSSSASSSSTSRGHIQLSRADAADASENGTQTGPDIIPLGDRELPASSPSSQSSSSTVAWAPPSDFALSARERASQLALQRLHANAEAVRAAPDTVLTRTAAAVHESLYAKHDGDGHAIANQDSVGHAEDAVLHSSTRTQRLGGSFGTMTSVSTPRRTVKMDHQTFTTPSSTPTNHRESASTQQRDALLWQYASSPLASARPIDLSSSSSDSHRKSMADGTHGNAPTNGNAQTPSAFAAKPRPSLVNTLPWEGTVSSISSIDSSSNHQLLHQSPHPPDASPRSQPSSMVSPSIVRKFASVARSANAGSVVGLQTFDSFTPRPLSSSLPGAVSPAPPSALSFSTPRAMASSSAGGWSSEYALSPHSLHEHQARHLHSQHPHQPPRQPYQQSADRRSALKRRLLVERPIDAQQRGDMLARLYGPSVADADATARAAAASIVAVKAAAASNAQSSQIQSSSSSQSRPPSSVSSSAQSNVAKNGAPSIPIRMATMTPEAAQSQDIARMLMSL